jgi:hypothetical protein
MIFWEPDNDPHTAYARAMTAWVIFGLVLLVSILSYLCA